MAIGGLTFGDIKAQIATVAANGVGPDDPRVMARTNDAQQQILSEIIPVNAMMTVDIVASGTTILLPATMENAISVEVQGAGQVNSQSDVKGGWYNIVNPFAYVDDSVQHDNPLVDEFLQPDGGDPSILRRQYDFPGLTPNATVRITGKKRFIPITADGDYLIVQNALAIKWMVLSIEYALRSDLQNSKTFHDKSIELLQQEVKQHLLDPRNSMKRRAGYEADLTTYARSTFGWMRAMLAFELPNGLSMGKSELSRLLDLSEMRLMNKGQWVGTFNEYTASVTGGHIVAPAEVQTIIAIDLCGQSIDVRNTMFEYIRSGPQKYCNCFEYLIDEGEIRFADNSFRRQYRLRASTDVSQSISFLAKLRWLKKAPTDFMQIKNFEAIRLMAQCVMLQQQEKWGDAVGAEQLAIQEVERELNSYLSGQVAIIPVQLESFRNCGGIL